MTTESLVCPSDDRYRITLDASEVIPDDPGAGTPAMLYGPNGLSGTFFCALDTGELDGVDLPNSVCRWLLSVEETVSEYVDTALSHAKKPSLGM